MSLPSVHVDDPWIQRVSTEIAQNENMSQQAATALVCSEVPVCRKFVELKAVFNLRGVDFAPFEQLMESVTFHAGADGCKHCDIKQILIDHLFPVFKKNFDVAYVENWPQQIINVKEVQNQYNIASEMEKRVRDKIKQLLNNTDLFSQEGVYGDRHMPFVVVAVNNTNPKMDVRCSVYNAVQLLTLLGYVFGNIKWVFHPGIRTRSNDGCGPSIDEFLMDFMSLSTNDLDTGGLRSELVRSKHWDMDSPKRVLGDLYANIFHKLPDVNLGLQSAVNVYRECLCEENGCYNLQNVDLFVYVCKGFLQESCLKGKKKRGDAFFLVVELI